MNYTDGETVEAIFPKRDIKKKDIDHRISIKSNKGVFLEILIKAILVEKGAIKTAMGIALRIRANIRFEHKIQGVYQELGLISLTTTIRRMLASKNKQT